MVTAGGWARTIELFVFVTLLALGSATIVAASWANDYARPRATVLGSDRGLSVLITAGSARMLIVNGTDAAALGNAVFETRHPGLDRLDLLVVSGNSAGTALTVRAIELLQPRLVAMVGSAADAVPPGIRRDLLIDKPTDIELPDGVLVSIELWPAADGENDDVTWTAIIERGGASIFWASDREALMREPVSDSVDVVIVGRGSPANDTPFPDTRTVLVAGESILGPELRALALDSIGPEVQTGRVFAGEALRIDLNSEGIRTVPGAIPAGTPESS